MSSYSLELANGQSWHILAGRETRQWVDRLATIMELRPCARNLHPRLLIVRKACCVARSTKACANRDPDPIHSPPAHGRSVRLVGQLRFWYIQDTSDVLCDIDQEENWDKEILKMWDMLLLLSWETQPAGGLPLHGALLEKQGIGAVLAASGGRGKSTSCRRIPAPWRSLCDNETLVVKVEDGKYSAHPLPTWSECFSRGSERTWNVEEHVPIRGLFFLEQAETDEAIPLGNGEALSKVMQSVDQVLWRLTVPLSQEERRRHNLELLGNASDLVLAVPSYILRTTLRGSFWQEMERVLT